LELAQKSHKRLRHNFGILKLFQNKGLSTIISNTSYNLTGGYFARLV